MNTLKFAYIMCLVLSAVSCGSSKDSDSAPVGPGRPLTESAGPDSDGKTLSQKGLAAIEIDWSPSLRAGTLANSATLHFHDPKEGTHIPAVLKSFKLYMTTMGHASIKADAMKFTTLETGHVKVENIYFSMPGPAQSWAVDLEFEVNGQADSVRMPIHAEVN